MNKKILKIVSLKKKSICQKAHFCQLPPLQTHLVIFVEIYSAFTRAPRVKRMRPAKKMRRAYRRRRSATMLATCRATPHAPIDTSH